MKPWGPGGLGSQYCGVVFHCVFRVQSIFFTRPNIGVKNQYIRLEPLTAESPQTMATRNVTAMGYVETGEKTDFNNYPVMIKSLE